MALAILRSRARLGTHEYVVDGAGAAGRRTPARGSGRGRSCNRSASRPGPRPSCRRSERVRRRGGPRGNVRPATRLPRARARPPLRAAARRRRRGRRRRPRIRARRRDAAWWRRPRRSRRAGGRRPRHGPPPRLSTSSAPVRASPERPASRATVSRHSIMPGRSPRASECVRLSRMSANARSWSVSAARRTRASVRTAEAVCAGSPARRARPTLSSSRAIAWSLRPTPSYAMARFWVTRLRLSGSPSRRAIAAPSS